MRRPAQVPSLRVGEYAGDHNFIFDDVDGDGRLNLVVSAAKPAEGQADIAVYLFDDDANGAAWFGRLGVTEETAFPLPSNCPMPANQVRVLRVNEDLVPDFVCIRPGTIDVAPGTSTAGTYSAVVRNEFPFYQASDPALQGEDGEFFPWTSGVPEVSPHITPKISFKNACSRSSSA